MVRISPRYLEWEVSSENNPEVHHWNILIVNEPIEIGKIQQRIKERFANTDEETTRTEGFISGSDGLHYKLITFDSYNVGPRDIEWGKIYLGRTKRNPNLREHKTPDGLANYVDKMFSS